MMLFIDKIVAQAPKFVCFILIIICSFISRYRYPYVATTTEIEGVISKYEAVERIHARGGGFGTSITHLYLIYINDNKLYIPYPEQLKFKAKNEDYWKKILEGKSAKVVERNHDIYSIELEDGSYSYHDPHPLEYYNRGYFPFCITAPLAVISLLILLRYFYLLTFASDERRKQVFGDENYNPF